MIAVLLLIAVLASATLLALRLAQWFERRYSLRTDAVVGVYLLMVLFGWWLAGAFLASTGTVFLGLSALVYVVSATGFLLWGHNSLKKNKFSS